MPGDYPYDQQAKDFLKLQAKYALLLKQKLDAGEITQEQFDQNIWLATQQLQNPYPGFANEFLVNMGSDVDTALQWLSQETGESVSSLATYMGQAIGAGVAKVASGIASGAISGFGGNISLGGGVLLLGVLFVAFIVFRKELHL